MAVTLKTKAIEGSTYVIPCTFRREDGAPVNPLSVRWTLAKPDKTVINNRLHVSQVPAKNVNIVLTGPDLIMDEVGELADRKVLVEWWYNSSYGNGLYGKEEINFQIQAAKLYPVTTTTTTTTTTV